MNIIRKGFAVLAALALATAAGGALAQNVKHFSLATVTPSPVAVTTTTMVLKFTNLENGNSTFNSIGIKGTMSGGTLSIMGGSASPGGPGTPSSPGDGYFYLTGLSPVKKGQSITVTLTVAIAGGGCPDGGIVWHGRAFTGSPSQPSTEFQQSNADPSTAVTMGCKYSISGSAPPSMAKGTSRMLAITVGNAATSTSSISSVGLTAPAGISITGSPFAVSIAPGTQGVIDVPATAGCGASGAGGSWTSSIAGFTIVGAEPATSVTGACSIAFTGAPSSVIAGKPFTIGVTAKDGADAPLVGFTGSVTLVLTGTGCTLAGTNPVAAVDGIAGFNVTLNVDDVTGACTLKATTTIDGKAFATVPLTLSVYDATLACTAQNPPIDALNLPPSPIPAVPPAGMFDGSDGGATSPMQTGFVYGARGFGDFKGADDCHLINFALFNNIPTANTADMIDPLGNVVPPGFWSFTFDNGSPTTNPVVAVVSTFRPEWGDGATGLPTRVTQICTVTPCPGGPVDFPAAWKTAPACNSTLVLHSSIPAGEKGCVAAQTWWSVDASNCTTSPPATPPGVLPRCLRVSTTVILGEDPVFGR